MTDEEKQERAAKARAARAAAAKKRAMAVEKQEVAEVRAVWDLIDDEKKRIFEYIRKQIAGGKRTPSEVSDLRETRAVHFAAIKRRISTKEASQ